MAWCKSWKRALNGTQRKQHKDGVKVGETGWERKESAGWIREGGKGKKFIHPHAPVRL